MPFADRWKEQDAVCAGSAATAGGRPRKDAGAATGWGIQGGDRSLYRATASAGDLPGAVGADARVASHNRERGRDFVWRCYGGAVDLLCECGQQSGGNDDRLERNIRRWFGEELIARGDPRAAAARAERERRSGQCPDRKADRCRIWCGEKPGPAPRGMSWRTIG